MRLRKVYIRNLTNFHFLNCSLLGVFFPERCKSVQSQMPNRSWRENLRLTLRGQKLDPFKTFESCWQYQPVFFSFGLCWPRVRRVYLDIRSFVVNVFVLVTSVLHVL